ncbi:MAG: hypothetical protein EKK48_03895 [Candidatus Melainabacteria bacterium]|nr:MAG: hypothetical protein EKK48_03895 [Candidatus Melainabacteria bacterium]
MSSLTRLSPQTSKAFARALVLFLEACIFSGLSQLPAISLPVVDQRELQLGIQSFNSKHYSDAISHLQFYVNANQHDAVGHYYMANCLCSLGYQQPAIDEYGRALKESTSQKLTDYCREAIRSMQASKQNSGSSNTVSAVASSVGSAAARTTVSAGSSGGVQTQPVDGGFRPMKLPLPMQSQLLRADASSGSILDAAPPVVPKLTVDPVLLYQNRSGVPDRALEKTLTRMVEQTNSDLDGLQKDNSAELLSIKDHLATTISRLNRDCDLRIQAAIDSSQRSTTSTSSSLENSIDSIKKDTQIKIENAKRAAESQALALQQDILYRAGKLIAASQLSQSQIADARKIPGSPNLQLAGSDLYTRNYLPSPEPPPPDQLLATPERLILDAHTSPGKILYRVVKETPPPVIAPETDLKVHGELVK